MPEPDITNVADSTRARVADVLKAGLERDLANTAEILDLAVAGHGSHVVSNKFDPGAAAQEDGDMLLSWDDEKFEKFAERLSELRDTVGPLR